MEEILVSVVMATYQHEKYIKKSLDSVLMQNVKFSYEILLADDFSTDGTREILLGYKDKYPDLIKLIFNEQRIGPVQNFIGLLKNVRGKYIAFLEGDDFWTDRDKLQIQIDFLEQNDRYSGVFHNVSVIGNQITVSEICKSDITKGKDYIKWMPHIPTCSLVCHTDCLNDFGKYSKTYYLADRIIHALMLKSGDIKYLDKKMAVYRHITHSGTSYSAQKAFLPLKEGDDFLNIVGEILNCQDEIYKVIFINRKRVLDQLFWENRLLEMVKFYFNFFTLNEKIAIIKSYLSK